MSDAAQATRIKAVVAKVMNNDLVIINKGSDDGLAVGQSFLVYELGDDVIDPTTGESLGPLEIVKGRGKVVYLQSHMAQLKSIETNSKRTRSRTGFMPMLDGVNEEITDAPYNGVKVGDLCRPV